MRSRGVFGRTGPVATAVAATMATGTGAISGARRYRSSGEIGFRPEAGQGTAHAVRPEPVANQRIQEC